MKIENLWDKQQPLTEKTEVVIKDIAEGRVPELPYFIVGIPDVKKRIKEKLCQIDGERMINTVVVANYGVGKTNLVKYLDLYFRHHPQYNTCLLYQNANVDQTDIFMVLLRMLQFHSMEELVSIVCAIKGNQDLISKLACGYESNFGVLKNYTNHLFAVGNDIERIREIILLGTGQLYSVRNFNRIGLNPLSNFDRRCVLVLFLNMLSYIGKHIIFALDELENMYNKSKKRFSLFLSTYRDLIDLFNQINGHYLISCFTNASSLEQANEPFYSRIQNDMVLMDYIKKKEDVLDMVKYIQDEIVHKTMSADVASDIANQIAKQAEQGVMNTRDLIRIIVAKLSNEDRFEGLDSYLEKHEDLQKLYEESKQFLLYDGALGDVAGSFFDPLQYYLESLGYSDVKSNLKRKELRSFIDVQNDRALLFVLSNNQNVTKCVNTLFADYSVRRICVFAEPQLSEKMFYQDALSTTFIDYEPNRLLILLDMYKSNIDRQEDIAELIHQYTNNVL